MGLMILVSIDRCHVILFSTNHTVYISKDFPLESFVYQDVNIFEQCMNVISVRHESLGYTLHHLIQTDRQWITLNAADMQQFKL